MKKLLILAAALAIAAHIHAWGAGAESFTDDAGRKITVTSEDTKKTAVLQGSILSLWLLSGGEAIAATDDCFSEPPEMTEKQAAEANSEWETDSFSAHKKGVFAMHGKTGNAANVGTMMHPNAELLISSGARFALLSANIQSHRSIARILEGAGIKCAFFDYDGFGSYMRILKIFCALNGRQDLFGRFGSAQQSRVAAAESRKPGSGKTFIMIRASSASVSAKASDSVPAALMIKQLGASNIADTDSLLTENLSVEKIMKDDPDFIFVITMGADERKALESVRRTLSSNPAWASLSATKNGRFIVLPRELFHFKPGARWAESYEILERILGN